LGIERELTSKHAPLLGQTGALGVDALGLAGDNALGLIEGNAERLGAHAGSSGVLGHPRVLLRLAGAEFLDLILALLCETVRDDTNVLVIEGGGEIIPVGDELAMSAELVICTLVQILVDGLEQSRNRGGQLIDGNSRLAILTGNVTTSGRDEATSGLARTEFNTQRDTTKFPVVELPAGGVAFSLVAIGTDTCSLQGGDKAVDLIVELLPLLIGSLGSDTDRDDDRLGLSNARRKDQTAVVTVDHGHDTQSTGGQTPRVLPDVKRRLLLIRLGRWVLDGDSEHLAEVLAKTV
jgi:hypothetical protein